MDDPELTTFVIYELGKNRRRSDIVMEVCERTGMDWQAAQKLVYEVAFDNRKNVAARKSPLAIIFGVAFVFGGLALALGSVMATVQGVSLTYQGIPFAGNIAGIGFGTVLIAGGVIGLWDTLKEFM
jgi:hypothetical protein